MEYGNMRIYVRTKNTRLVVVSNFLFQVHITDYYRWILSQFSDFRRYRQYPDINFPEHVVFSFKVLVTGTLPASA